MSIKSFKKKRVNVRERIKRELEAPTPNLENIIRVVEDYEKDNIRFIEKLKKEKSYEAKRISGALKQTIHAHGPITSVLIGSATKRILGSLLNNETVEKDCININKGTVNLIICGIVVAVALAILLL